jgi:predicted enzyme related to lactoylglutathione lyase
MRGRVDGDESTHRDQRKDYWGVVLDAPDPHALGQFYASLLGWEITHDDGVDVNLIPPNGVAYLAIQLEREYVRPVWPAAKGQQQMMLHLDFEVTDLEAALAHALELGAQLPEFQPQANVRVLLDPAGHPFCLYTGS